MYEEKFKFFFGFNRTLNKSLSLVVIFESYLDCGMLLRTKLLVKKRLQIHKLHKKLI